MLSLVFLMGWNAHAISQDEQDNYLKIKNEYINSDAELNFLYKKNK